MRFAIWLPLLLPLLAAPAARRLADRLPPRAAAWTLTGTAALLGCTSTAAPALLALAGLLRLPPVAALGRLSLPWLDRVSPAAVPMAVVAAAALLLSGGLLLRAALRHRRDLATARALVGAAGSRDAAAPELSVLPDERATAYALPGRPGRIVVTTGMLRTLTAQERSALLAHERAHLTGRHHRHLAAAEYAAVLHPALWLLRAPLAYHLERWADESAAAVVGSRAVTARAIGRAALAAAAHPAAPRPGLAPAAGAGPVPRRVSALLAPPAPQPPARYRTAAAALLAACLLASAGAALDAGQDLHRTVEDAQAAPAR
ncbi:M56 family metallopeptidase [Streptomyces sp. NPDC092296]|uniref:M56 family metallopeptidase n=1 Tax=Streptomyces sp. NPDC092296 TaxID=3366012 RepID=UPI00381C2811